MLGIMLFNVLSIATPAYQIICNAQAFFIESTLAICDRPRYAKVLFL
tara:strand:+ start:3724 stop:3864 length:141 start_codon:yes stop_codon:yes gene_type:complete